ncbi:MAG: hypothetical protein EZS28_051426 [Streblomastix strix]|uniref:Reverse transcriptase RNase H-like domain-containing protein n=1 Tax=Streblomastix strix TaxID=222440 RepID=A0A5J4T3M1_9EUKA|nr:MAG: hypothetical protein EZS28_051426 [Streblomastix strix]
MGMRQFRGILKDQKALLIRTDNTVTEYNVRRLRGKGDLLPLMRKLRILIMELGLTIQTEHISGQQNTTADIFGRIEINGKYKLDPDVLRKACTALGIRSTINGFSTRTNKQRKRYCSWLSDRNAVKQDCFNMNWSLECFLLHPSKKMILRNLSKIWRDQATALVIMPNWRGQIWNDLQRRLTVSSVVLGREDDILIAGAVMKSVPQAISL